MTLEEDGNKFKISCQHYDDFVICSDNSGELIYMSFLHYRTYTLELYPEKLSTENLYFRWPNRTIIQRIYLRLLKEGNGDQNLSWKCLIFKCFKTTEKKHMRYVLKKF